MTDLPLKSEPGLRRIGLDEGDVGNAVGNDLDLVVRHLIDAAQQLAALVGHHDDLRRGLDDALHDSALHGVGSASTVWSVVTTGMVRRDSSSRMWRAGFATENSEFVLQAHDVEPAGIQEIRCTHVVFDVAILDLQSDRRRDNRRLDRDRSSPRCRSPGSGVTSISPVADRS